MPSARKTTGPRQQAEAVTPASRPANRVPPGVLEGAGESLCLPPFMAVLHDPAGKTRVGRGPGERLAIRQRWIVIDGRGPRVHVDDGFIDPTNVL